MTCKPTASRADRPLLTGCVTFWLLVLAPAAQAQDLTFPGNATLQTREQVPQASYDAPVGIWAGGILPVTTVEGDITREAWRIASPGLTSLQVLRPLRAQLQNDRFRVVFECQTEACGGFDFRFATAMLPPPEMQVNLGDFRFLTAVRDSPTGPDYVTLVVSPTAQAGFVQVTRVAPLQAPTATPVDPPLAVSPEPQGEARIVDQLDAAGRAVLSDLVFEPGVAVLQDQPFASLASLAAYLKADPDRSATLVGHTDSTGGSAANMILSERRAAAVLDRLVATYGVDRRQLAASGIGYLAPIATNQTAAGRETNRRVEVVMTSPR